MAEQRSFGSSLEAEGDRRFDGTDLSGLAQKCSRGARGSTETAAAVSIGRPPDQRAGSHDARIRISFLRKASEHL